MIHPAPFCKSVHLDWWVALVLNLHPSGGRNVTGPYSRVLEGRQMGLRPRCYGSIFQTHDVTNDLYAAISTNCRRRGGPFALNTFAVFVTPRAQKVAARRVRCCWIILTMRWNRLRIAAVLNVCWSWFLFIRSFRPVSVYTQRHTPYKPNQQIEMVSHHTFVNQTDVDRRLP